MNEGPPVDWIVRGAALSVLAIVSAAVFLAFELLGEIRGDIARVETTVQLASQPEAIVAYAQLSSAKTQDPGPLSRDGQPRAVQMEFRDAIKNVGFDPRRDATHIRIEIPGAYFVIAAPQTASGAGCLDLWIATNDQDVANSNIRVCQPEGETVTTVGVSQGVMCLREGDTVSFMMTGIGIEATQPQKAPLIPSIIASVFRLGGC